MNTNEAIVKIIYLQSLIHLFMDLLRTNIMTSPPVGSSAQLVECCTGITEILGSNPVQARFFRALFSLLLE